MLSRNKHVRSLLCNHFPELRCPVFSTRFTVCVVGDSISGARDQAGVGTALSVRAERVPLNWIPVSICLCSSVEWFRMRQIERPPLCQYWCGSNLGVQKSLPEMRTFSRAFLEMVLSFSIVHRPQHYPKLFLGLSITPVVYNNEPDRRHAIDRWSGQKATLWTRSCKQYMNKRKILNAYYSLLGAVTKRTELKNKRQRTTALSAY